MEFVRQLKAYGNVSTCRWKWTNQYSKGRIRTAKNVCFQDIVKKYKFYLAFENSLCEDYLSEKVAQFMNIPSVPIIMSNAKVEQYLPTNSYINVFDFTSIKDLADYILYLDENFDEYFKYFTWRTKWRVETRIFTRPKVKCDLCDLLIFVATTDYKNIFFWFQALTWTSLKCNNKLFSIFGS